MLLDFVVGGFLGAMTIFGYLALIALFEWIDMRPVHRLRRDLAKQSKPRPHGS